MQNFLIWLNDISVEYQDDYLITTIIFIGFLAVGFSLLYLFVKVFDYVFMSFCDWLCSVKRKILSRWRSK